MGTNWGPRQDKPSKPESVERYLQGKFKDRYGDARTAMETLARSLPSKQLANTAYHLYEEFRPTLPAGVLGWGAAGKLDLDVIKKLARG